MRFVFIALVLFLGISHTLKAETLDYPINPDDPVIAGAMEFIPHDGQNFRAYSFEGSDDRYLAMIYSVGLSQQEVYQNSGPSDIVTLQPSDSTMSGRSGNFPVSK